MRHSSSTYHLHSDRKSLQSSASANDDDTMLDNSWATPQSIFELVLRRISRRDFMRECVGVFDVGVCGCEGVCNLCGFGCIRSGSIDTQFPDEICVGIFLKTSSSEPPSGIVIDI